MSKTHRFYADIIEELIDLDSREFLPPRGRRVAEAMTFLYQDSDEATEMIEVPKETLKPHEG